MNRNEEKRPPSFPWIRAVRDEIYRDTKGLEPGEVDAYFKARAEKARKSRIQFTPEEAIRVIRSATSPESKAPSRKAKPTAKTAASRRKVAKRLAHA